METVGTEARRNFYNEHAGV